jgi:hypothetical protein
METLEPLPKDRKCFRLINGVLVERTVADVLPALKTNSDGLKQVLEELLKQYKGKQDEMDKWKVCHAMLLSIYGHTLTLGRERTISRSCKTRDQNSRKRPPNPKSAAAARWSNCSGLLRKIPVYRHSKIYSRPPNEL